MKVLQVNNVYGEKSTGKLTKELHRGLLLRGHESLVVYGRGKTFREDGVLRLCPDWYGKANSFFSRFSGMPYGGCFFSTERLKRIIRREKPDVVHLQCINGNFVNIYRLIRWLKKKRIKTVCSLHAEFMYTANCGHAFDCEQWKKGCTACPDKWKATKSILFDRTGCSWKSMKVSFEGFEEDCVICPVSLWTEERARQSDILKGFPFCTVLNGVNSDDVFCWLEGEEKEKNTVLNVTAFFSVEREHPKGGWYILQLAEHMPEVTFLVAGRADEIGDLPDNLKLLGEIKDQKELAELYRKAALSIIVSKKETFSMPCAESLCCGTPVVGFRAGAPEQIALSEYSEYVEYGNIEALEQVISDWLERDTGRAEDIARAAQERYSVETMVETFLEVYGSLL